MVIETLRLKDFRNYDELRLEPSPNINLLYGQNGSGKTNIIEAIHYCSLGKSHRTNQDRDVLRNNTFAAACGVTLSKKTGREEIAIKLTPGEVRKKNVFLDRKKMQKISSLMGHMQCVIFSPEDLMLIKEGPGIRRKYIDMMISQVEPLYFIELQKYVKALEQRNAILKECRKYGVQEDDMMESFEIQMASSSSYIISKRVEMVEKVNQSANELYNIISGRDNEIFSMIYSSCIRNYDEIEIEKEIRDTLKNNRKEDIYKGITTFGIHREDLKLLLNGREMKISASQGQIRTAALSMKLAQIDLFKNETEENPILLLDDVMSELDMGRRVRLIERIKEIQTFITCTDESDIEFKIRPTTFFVYLNDKNIGTINNIYTDINKIKENVLEINDPDFT